MLRRQTPACARDLAGGGGIGDRLHLGLEDRGVGDANGLDVEEMRERPAGVVIGMLLRIVRRPVLAVEQRIGDAGVGLVHADDDSCRRESASRGLGLSLASSLSASGQRLRQFDSDGRWR